MTQVEEGKLIATVEHLSVAVTRLTSVVERLENRQSYQGGAIAMFIMITMALGFGIEAAIQWFHK